MNRTSRTGQMTRYYLSIMIMMSFVIITSTSQGSLAPVAALSQVIFLILFPAISWILAARIQPARKFFWLFARIFRRFNAGYYFESAGKRVHSIERRALELTLPVLGVSALFAEKIVKVSFQNGFALVVFLAFAILTLSLSSLPLIAIWVFEDSGFRSHQSGSTTLGIPLSAVKGSMVYGGLGAYLSFSWSLAGSLLGAFAFTLALLFFVVPPCYLIAILFDHRIATKAIGEVRSAGASAGFPLKSMSVT